MEKALRKPSIPQRIVRDVVKHKWVYIMIIPVVVYFIMFKYMPMGWLAMSFYDFKLLKGFSGSKFVGLKHFIKFFTSTSFDTLFWNTIIFNFWAILFQSIAPIILALLVNEVRQPKLKKYVQTVSFLPYFVSTVVVVSMLNNLLSPATGLLNVFRRSMGLESVYYLGFPEYFRGVNYISGVWQMVGWNSIVYISALTGIDQQMYEAAIVDGASRLQRLIHITVPSITTTIAIMLTLNIGNLIAGCNVEKVLLLQNDLNLSVSELLPTFVYKQGLVNGKYSYATAIGLFTSVVSCLLVIIANFFSNKLSNVEVGVF